jgi:hypothetical protein
MITIDKNGWINPVCPYCSFVMSINYHRWLGVTIMNADFNLYCKECHYAVSIEPATTDQNCKSTKIVVTRYNESHYLQEEEE